jgi:hypothetical protein
VCEQAPDHLGLVAGLSRLVALKGHPVQLVVQPQGVDDFRGARQKRANAHGHSPPSSPAFRRCTDVPSTGIGTVLDRAGETNSLYVHAMGYRN